MRLKCWESKLAEQGLPEEEVPSEYTKFMYEHYGNLACKFNDEQSIQCCECCFASRNLYD